jgi:nucleoside permease NupC
MLRLTSLLGIFVLLLVGWAISNNRRLFPWRTVIIFAITVAIRIRGIGALALERRRDLARIGLQSMIAGLLACYLFAAVSGVIID